jgi:catechol 2,3-dioxygenase-like lactoylglutathione lyase family enzyme
MIKRTDHVGISVSNLQRSIRFYCDGLGMKVLEEESFEGSQYDQILGLQNAKGRVAILKVDQLQLELFEFLRPEPRTADPDRPVCDQGLTHFCIEVTDLEGVCEQLKAAGARFHSPPLLFFGTTRATYVRDPDGNVFELIEQRAENQAPR